MSPFQKRSRANDLHQKIGRVNGAVAQLVKERTKLFEELNDIEPLISVLPPEILCLIFLFARPSGFTIEDYRQTELFCCLKFVSKHWHRVLLSNPVIWTKVDVCIPSSPAARLGLGLRANPLLLFLRHSGRLPLSLGIRYPLNFPEDDTTLIHPYVDGFLLQNLRRITHLRLEYPPPAWVSHLHLLKQATHIHLINCHEILPPLSFDQAVCLSEFTLDSSPLIQLASALPVTTLNLISIPLSTSFQIFTNCLNLRNLLLFCELTYAVVPLPVPPANNFTLPHLERLHWSTRKIFSGQWVIAILTHIRLPSLRTLEWEWPMKIETPALETSITGFFAILPTTLTSLTLRFLRRLCSSVNKSIKEDIYEIPPQHHHLESIELVGCTMRYMTAFLEIIQSSCHFPRLHIIKINGLNEELHTRWGIIREEPFDQEQQDHLSCACLKMLRERMRLSDEQFILEVHERISENTMQQGVVKKILAGLTELGGGGRITSTYAKRNDGSHHEYHELTVCWN